MAEKMWRISICMIMAFLLCACAGNTNMEKKVRDLDFTVVSTADISEELKKHIDERKEESGDQQRQVHLLRFLCLYVPLRRYRGQQLYC